MISKFIVYACLDDGLSEIGSALVPISSLAGKKIVEVDVESEEEPKGLLIIHSEEVSNKNEFFTLQFSVQDLVKKDLELNQIFITLNRVKPGRNYIRVYRSEFLRHDPELEFQPFTIRIQHLCGNQERVPLKFEVYEHLPGTKRTNLLGSGFTTLIDLKNKKQITIGENSAMTGLVSVLQSENSLEDQNINSGSFLDYLRSGTNISVIVAIDFTASNGRITNPKSLHFISGEKQNEYEQAIITVCSILEKYDTDKMFPVFGFGGIFEENSGVDHCYPLNRSPNNPEVEGVSGILNAYRDTLERVILNAPTCMEGIIRKVKEIAETTEPGQVYSILLILTDGDVTDLEETKSAIIDASNLALSIIIVGVGSDSFENMIELDGDQIPLRDSLGRVTSRDIVQFVPFRKFKDNLNELASEVLYEIPTQVESFMSSHGLSPSSNNQIL